MNVSNLIETAYDEHARALHAYALVLTRDRSDAEEAVQAVFGKLARRPGALREARDARALLWRWCHDAAVDLIRGDARRRERQRRWHSERVSPFAAQADPDARAFAEAASEALGTLPLEQRSAVHLFRRDAVFLPGNRLEILLMDLVIDRILGLAGGAYRIAHWVEWPGLRLCGIPLFQRRIPP